VFERGGGRQAGGLLQFPDQLPTVQRIQQIDKAGGAIQNGQGQFSLGHK
jgi:hypothetical protein